MDDDVKNKILKILSRIEDRGQKLRKNDMEFILNYSKKYDNVKDRLKKAMNKRYVSINDLYNDFGFN